MTTTEQTNRRLSLPAISKWLRNVNYEYDNIIDQQRASALVYISSIMLVLPLLMFIVLLLFLPEFFTPVSVGVAVILVIVALGGRYLAEIGRLTLGAVVILAGIEIALTMQFIVVGYQPETSMAFVAPIILAAILLDVPFVFGTMAASMLGMFIAISPGLPDNVAIMGDGQAPLEEVIASLFVVYFLMVLVTIVATTLTRRLRTVSGSTDRVSRRLEAAAVVADVASSQTGLQNLLTVVVERIREAFDFYHAQVFLLDEEGRNANLIASTGRAGEALLARAHSLPVGSQSVIGRCTASGEPIVVNDTELSATHRPNPLLPRTRAELALPLMIEERVIGAIDVQSVEPDVFQPDDVRSLQVLAAQLAASVAQARLIDNLQEAARQNQELLQEAQDSLIQIEELNRRLIREGWTEFIREKASSGNTVGFTLTEGQSRQDNSWTAPMKQAYRGAGSVIVQQDDQAHVAAIPVRVRGEVVGVLEVERSAESPWTEDDIAMAETLVERLALAVENARLYEQANRAVGREQLVNRVGQGVQAAASVDEVLQTALSELSDILGARRGAVQIAPERPNEQLEDGAAD